jgi:hypothetical protein
MGTAAGASEADLPAEDFLAAVRAEGARRGAGAGCSGEVGWGKVAGLWAGVVSWEEPLSKFNVLKPTRCVDGDGASCWSESGESRARPFPFSPASLRRYSRTSSADNGRRSAFPVEGFWGIRLHLTFFTLHCSHAPVGEMSQVSPAFSHRSHCHRLLAPESIERAVTYLKFGLRETCNLLERIVAVAPP